MMNSELEKSYLKAATLERAHAATVELRQQGLQVASSGLAGAVARFSTHPFDTVRARLQVDRHGGLVGKRTVFAEARNIIRQEGVASLYSGVTVAMAFTAPALALFLSTYDFAKAQLVARGGSKDSLAVHLQAGVCAEVFSGALWTPMEIVKQQLQVRASDGSRLYRGGLEGLVSIAKTEGLLGLYRGYFLTLMVFVPQSAVLFATYERLKLALKEAKNAPLSPIEIAACSTGAAVTAAAAANPFDVVKTRWQVQRQPVVGSKSAPWLGLNYDSPWQMMRLIVREEGLRGFTKGMAARVLWMAPSTAVSIGSYELLKRYLALQ